MIQNPPFCLHFLADTSSVKFVYMSSRLKFGQKSDIPRLCTDINSHTLLHVQNSFSNNRSINTQIAKLFDGENR